MCVYVCKYICIQMYVCMYICKYICVQMCVYVCTCTHVCVCNVCMHRRMDVFSEVINSEIPPISSQLNM